MDAINIRPQTGTPSQAERVAWPLVSIVSVNYKQAGLTQAMLDSLREVSYPAVQTIVVDNESDGESVPKLAGEYPEAIFLYSPENLGFAGGNNLGFTRAEGKYVLLLNNDTEVDPGFLEPMVEMMEQRPEVGIVSPKIYFFDYPETLQYAGTTPIHPITSRGRKFGYRELDQGQHDLPRETGYANGACMLIRRELIEDLGHMAEDYFLYYEEHDFTERIKQAGYQVMFQPKGKIYHKVSASTGALSPLKAFYLHRNRLVFILRTQKGLTRVLAVLYYLGVATSKAWLTYLLQGDQARRKAIQLATWRALKGDMRRF
ncbi:MAG: glycosyltransferase family 2 protein [Bacteroidota bacterium]